MKSELEGIYRLAAIVTVILFAYILTFLHKLESTGCECARDWRRNYIIFYAYLQIALALLSLMNFDRFRVMIVPLTIALGIMFVIFAFQYVHRLRREKCACSEDIGRTILYIVAAIDAAIFAIIGVLILTSVIAVLLNSK